MPTIPIPQPPAGEGKGTVTEARRAFTGPVAAGSKTADCLKIETFVGDGI